MRKKQKMKWKDIKKVVKTMEGKRPESEHAVKNAVARADIAGARGIASSRYENCGRRYGEDGGKYMITKKQEKEVVRFVQLWRKKRFCTCNYIKRELKLEATGRTIARALNRNDYHWCQVSKKSPLTVKQLQKRKVWVNRFIRKSPTWWKQNMHLIYDGVTLTKAPKNLDSRQKHAAQSIRHMWMKKKEKLDPALHTYNRYGVQLGIKVPLWGGFTGDGTFSLRLWTDKPKMKKEEWAQHIPQLKAAAAVSGSSGHLSVFKTHRSSSENVSRGCLFPPFFFPEKKPSRIQVEHFPENKTISFCFWANFRFEIYFCFWKNCGDSEGHKPYQPQLVQKKKKIRLNPTWFFFRKKKGEKGLNSTFSRAFDPPAS